MKPDAKRQEGTDPSQNLNRPPSGCRNARDEPQQGTLAGAVGAYDREPFTALNADRQVTQSPELTAGRRLVPQDTPS